MAWPLLSISSSPRALHGMDDNKERGRADSRDSATWTQDLESLTVYPFIKAEEEASLHGDFSHFQTSLEMFFTRSVFSPTFVHASRRTWKNEEV